MCSYATFRIVGEQPAPQFSCGNTNLLNNIVKGQFGLKGFITSDYANASKATSDLIAGMDQEFISQSLTAAKLTAARDRHVLDVRPRLRERVGQRDRPGDLYEDERFGLLDNSKIPAAYQSDVPQHGDVTSTFNGTPGRQGRRHQGRARAGRGVRRPAQERRRHAPALDEQQGRRGRTDRLPACPRPPVASARAASATATTTPRSRRSRRLTARATSSRHPGSTGSARRSPPPTSSRTPPAPSPGWSVRPRRSDATPVVTTSADTIVDGNQTNLVKGYKYSWTGYINVPPTTRTRCSCSARTAPTPE